MAQSVNQLTVFDSLKLHPVQIDELSEPDDLEPDPYDSDNSDNSDNDSAPCTKSVQLKFKEVHGKAWYYRLKEDQEGLLRAIPRDSTGIFVCHSKIPPNPRLDANGRPKEDKSFFYCVSEADLILYQQHFQVKDRNFFEVIVRCPQKSHFDIDLKTDDGRRGWKLVEDLITALIRQYKQDFNVDLDIMKDIRVYSSCGPTKQSYHLIVINYYHVDNLQAEMLYKRVYEQMSNPDKTAIDPAVYKSIQQFRALGSQKPGSNRIKTLCRKFTYNGNLCENQPFGSNDQTPRSDRLAQEAFELSESLVSNIEGCQPLKSYTRNIQNIKHEHDLDMKPCELTEAKVQLTVDLLAKYHGMSTPEFNSIFKIRGTSGNRIDWNRSTSSKCLICERIHDGDGAYVYMKDNVFFYYCRRGGKKYVMINYYSKLGSGTADNTPYEEPYDYVPFGNIEGLVMQVPKKAPEPVISMVINDKILRKIHDLYGVNLITGLGYEYAPKNTYKRTGSLVHCPVCDMKHSTGTLTVNGINGVVQLICSHNTKILNAFRVDQPSTDVQYLEEIRNPKEFPSYIDCTRVHQRYLERFDIGDIRTFLVRAPVGTGKTLQAEDLIRRLSDKSVAFSSSRIQFAREKKKEMETRGLDFKCYLDQKDDSALKGPRLIISAESIHQIRYIPQVLVIDESTSFLGQMLSPFHKRNLSKNQERLVFLIKHAELVIAMDADLDSRTWNFIHRIRGGKIKMIWNTYQPYTDITATHVKDPLFLLKKLAQTVDQGYKVAVPVSSKKQGEMIRKYLLRSEDSNINIALYCKESDDNKDFEDINTAVYNYDVIIYTSSVNVGIDIHVEHFDYIFAFCNNRSVTPREMGQMIGRVRKVIQKQIYYSYDHRQFGYLPFSREGVRRQIIDLHNQQNDIPKDLATKAIEKAAKYYGTCNIAHAADLKTETCLDKFNKLIPKWEMTDSPYNQLIIEFMREQNHSKHFWLSDFKYLLKERGMQLNVNNQSLIDKARMVIQCELKEIKEEIREEYILEIDLADNLSVCDDAYIKLKQQCNVGQGSHADSVTLMKSEILSLVHPECRDLIPPEMIYALKDKMEQVHNLRNERDLTVADLQLMDADKHQQGYLIANKASKRVIVDELLNLLEMKTSTDVKTFTETKMNELTPRLEELAIKANIAWKGRICPNPKKGEHIGKVIINSILKAWCGTECKVDRKKVNYEWIRTYYTEPNEAIACFVSMMPSHVSKPISQVFVTDIMIKHGLPLPVPEFDKMCKMYPNYVKS